MNGRPLPDADFSPQYGELVGVDHHHPIDNIEPGLEPQHYGPEVKEAIDRILTLLTRGTSSAITAGVRCFTLARACGLLEDYNGALVAEASECTRQAVDKAALRFKDRHGLSFMWTGKPENTRIKCAVVQIAMNADDPDGIERRRTARAKAALKNRNAAQNRKLEEKRIAVLLGPTATPEQIQVATDKAIVLRLESKKGNP